MSQHLPSKKIRVTLDMDPEMHTLLEKLTRKRSGTKQRLIIKGLVLLDALDKEEVYLVTQNGDKIPHTITFS